MNIFIIYVIGVVVTLLIGFAIAVRDAYRSYRIDTENMRFLYFVGFCWPVMVPLVLFTFMLDVLADIPYYTKTLMEKAGSKLQELRPPKV